MLLSFGLSPGSSTTQGDPSRMEARVAALEQVEWLTGKVHWTEDRVDRLYAQGRVFTMHSQTLEDAWQALGDRASPTLMVETGAGEVCLQEVAKALGVAWPSPSSQPGREEMIYGLKARDVHDGLWALHDELRCLVRVEPDAARKAKTFTLVYRIGATADRVCLNKALTEANMAGQVLCWRAKTKGEKRRRAAMKQEAGAAGSADGQGQAKGRGKGKGQEQGQGLGKGERKGGRPRGWQVRAAVH